MTEVKDSGILSAIHNSYADLYVQLGKHQGDMAVMIYRIARCRLAEIGIGTTHTETAEKFAYYQGWDMDMLIVQTQLDSYLGYTLANSNEVKMFLKGLMYLIAADNMLIADRRLKPVKDAWRLIEQEAMKLTAARKLAA